MAGGAEWAANPGGAVAARWKSLTAGAIAVYLLLAAFYIAQRPGLQYDESLLILGAVHMRHSSGELTLPHDPDTWICPFGRCVPLMTVRYVGALKEYLCLPLFALFGTKPQVIRGISAVLGAAGILGTAAMTRRIAGRAAGAAAAWAMGVNPSYIDFTVFDNGAVAVWMACFGCLALALGAYLKDGGTRQAAWCGAAAGLGVWSRANFAWLAAALLVALALVFRGRAARPFSHWLAAGAGAMAAAAPLLVYQAISGGGTFEAVNMFRVAEGWGSLLHSRAAMFAEMLISNREHRAMWGGGEMASWQRWLGAGVAAASCVICLWRGRDKAPWTRVAALTGLGLAAFLFFSRLPVAEHHFIVLLPLVACLAACAGARIAKGPVYGRAAVAAAAAAYVVSAASWNAAAIRGLGATGGTGQWSDAIDPLAESLESCCRDKEIQILDWGLQNNLYVLSDGRIRSREIYGEPEFQGGGAEAAWLHRIDRGGLFLINGEENRHFPEATTQFLEVLRRYQPKWTRRQVRERGGKVYAELIEVTPGTRADEPREAGGGKVAAITAADEAQAHRLEGFHAVEDGRWRWTERRFASTLDAPEGPMPNGARVELAFFLPASSMERLGRITLSARLNDCPLEAKGYGSAGAFVYASRAEPRCVKDTGNRVAFVLDKALAPGEADGRELGVIVERVSLKLE